MAHTDTTDRVSLWVVPALVLLTHFNFSLLGILNFAAVVIHAIGDPIDSIWSLLTRIEVNRRLLRRAEDIFEIKAKRDEKRDENPGKRDEVVAPFVPLTKNMARSMILTSSKRNSKISRDEFIKIPPRASSHLWSLFSNSF